jgi:hypothetical protein
MHDADEIERRRDRTFRRLPALRVAGPQRAARFLDEAGLASLFAYRQLNLPCLWLAVCGRRDPVFPHHSQHDPEVAPWNLKDCPPAAGRGSTANSSVASRPRFVAAFSGGVHRLFGPRTDHHASVPRPLSPAAKAILTRCTRGGRRTRCRCSPPASRRRSTFDAAIAELQQTLRICMVEARVRYEPFTYVGSRGEASRRGCAAPRASARSRPRWRCCASHLATVIAATPNDAAMGGSAAAPSRARAGDAGERRRDRDRSRSRDAAANGSSGAASRRD